MNDDEIVRRLEHLERIVLGHVERHDRGRRHRDDSDERRRDGGDFDEKRIIDTIVDLVGQRVEEIVARQLAKIVPPTSR